MSDNHDDFDPFASELRGERPAPRGELLDSLVSRMHVAAPARSRRGSAWQLRLAVALTVLVTAAFGALGGFGAAASAAKGGASKATKIAKGDGRESERGGDNDERHHGDHHRRKVRVCIVATNKEIFVSKKLAKWLIASGAATLGHCPVP